MTYFASLMRQSGLEVGPTPDGKASEAVPEGVGDGVTPLELDVPAASPPSPRDPPEPKTVASNRGSRDDRRDVGPPPAQTLGSRILSREKGPAPSPEPSRADHEDSASRVAPAQETGRDPETEHEGHKKAIRETPARPASPPEIARPSPPAPERQEIGVIPPTSEYGTRQARDEELIAPLAGMPSGEQAPAVPGPLFQSLLEVRRWVAEGGSGEARSQPVEPSVVPARQTPVSRPGEAVPEPVPLAELEREPSDAWLRVPVAPREDMESPGLSVSIGTIQLTVEAPEASPPDPEPRRRRVSSMAPSPLSRLSRHYLRM